MPALGPLGLEHLELLRLDGDVAPRDGGCDEGSARRDEGGPLRRRRRAPRRSPAWRVSCISRWRAARRLILLGDALAVLVLAEVERLEGPHGVVGISLRNSKGGDKSVKWEDQGLVSCQLATEYTALFTS